MMTEFSSLQCFNVNLVFYGVSQSVWINCLANQELQKELELQIGLKQEVEVAMKLLEKDTHEKLDTLVALRQQLEQVKNLNLQMFNKAQVIHLVVWTTCYWNRITCNWNLSLVV